MIGYCPCGKGLVLFLVGTWTLAALFDILNAPDAGVEVAADFDGDSWTGIALGCKKYLRAAYFPKHIEREGWMAAYQNYKTTIAKNIFLFVPRFVIQACWQLGTLTSLGVKWIAGREIAGQVHLATALTLGAVASAATYSKVSSAFKPADELVQVPDPSLKERWGSVASDTVGELTSTTGGKVALAAGTLATAGVLAAAGYGAYKAFKGSKPKNVVDSSEETKSTSKTRSKKKRADKESGSSNLLWIVGAVAVLLIVGFFLLQKSKPTEEEVIVPDIENGLLE